MELKELLTIESKAERQIALKKAFMLYSEPMVVDGNEEIALIILLNLAQSKPTCKDYLDGKRANQYFKNEEYFSKSLNEVQWFHTHNLKYPDSRVKDQRVVADSSMPLGWAHNSGVYPHTIWLLNTFSWQSKETNLLREIMAGSTRWIQLLKKYGLTSKKLKLVKQAIERDLPTSTFPDEVSPYSKQVRFPYKGEYLSITPVVNHGVQIELERLARSQSSSFRFIPTSLPHPASIGNLCGSLGGNMRLLNYPIGIQPRNDSSLFASRNRTQRYFDDYQLTDKRACSVLAQLCGHHSKITRQKQVRSRKQQVAMLRKQIALWMLPLIELKERVEQDKNTPEIGDELAHRFVYVAESDLPQLQKELVQRVHHALQSNKYSRRYAYHQKLIQPIRTQIEWVLQQLAKPEGVEEKNTEEEQYIYLSSMRLQEGQAQSSPYLIGMPSLTAFWGFMHRFQLNLQKSGIEFEGFSFDSFSLFVREEHIYQSAKLSEPNAVTKIREISAAKRPTTRTDYYTDLVFDMVVKVKGNGRLSDDISSLKAALPTHLAGGTLFPPKIDSEINWIQTFVSRSSLYFQLKGLDACGSWVMPTESEPASLSGLQSLLLNDSTLIAASTGFRLLELPKERINALTKKHSYVENVLGVAKVVNPIEVRMSGLRHFFSSAFWSLQIESESILIKKQKSE